MRNVWACGELDESREISIMKESLKWQPLSAVTSAAGLYPCFTLKPNLTGERAVLCQRCCSAARAGYSSHIPQSSLPSHGRSHCSLSVTLLLGVQFPGLGGAQYEAKPNRVCVACWGRTLRKGPEMIFPAPLLESDMMFQGFIGSLDVSVFVLIGRLGCWSLLLEVPVSVWAVSLSCPFLEEQEAGAGRGAHCPQAAQHGQLHMVRGMGLSVPKQHQDRAVRSCRSPCLCRAMTEDAESLTSYFHDRLGPLW